MRIGLSQANQRVAQLTGQPVVPRKTYDAAIGGRFPAEFSGGRWTVNEADIPKIAEVLGLKVLVEASAPDKAVSAPIAVAA